jgi:eukaryotic translation initiation factor 2-alpha kinase 4
LVSAAFVADCYQVIELALNRVPHDIRDSVIEIIIQAKSSWAQKRAMLLKKGLLRSTVDELEILSDTGVTPLVFWTYRTFSIDVDEDLVTFVARLEKASLPLLTLMSPFLDEIKQAIRYVALAGVTRPILLHPLMISNHNTYFKDGVCFEVVRRNKRGDVLAAGGRLADLAMVTSSQLMSHT